MQTDLAALRKFYLSELIDDLTVLDQLLIGLEKGDEDAAATKKLSRMLHSIKGGAVSYELSLLSTLAHSMEDTLGEFTLGLIPLNDVCAKLFGQKDLLARLTQAYQDGDLTLLTTLEQQLIQRNSAPLPASPAGPVAWVAKHLLFIDSTQSIVKICAQQLKPKGISVSPCSDGYVAFGRLLREQFDLVVTSIKISSLAGDQLSNIVRSVDGPNQNTPFLFLTSTDAGSLKVDASQVVPKSAGVDGLIARIADTLSHSKPPAAHAALARKRILMVDDAKDMFMLIQLALRPYQVDLRHCSDPRQAVATAATFDPELILLDVEMPHLDGRELFPHLKRLRPNRPLAFLTGTDSQEGLASLKGLGPTGIIQKPFNLKDLPNQLAQLFAAN